MKNIENLKPEDFINAIVNYGGDPSIIEDIDLAADVMGDFKTADYRDIITPESGEDFEVACRRLDLTPEKARIIYYCHGWNEEGFLIAFSEDWDY